MIQSVTIDAGSTVKRTIGFVVMLVAVSFVGMSVVRVGIPALENVVGAVGPGATILVGLFALQLPMAIAAVLFLQFVVGWQFVSLEWPTRTAAITVVVATLLVGTVEAIRQLAVLFTALEAAGTVEMSEGISAPAAALLLFAMLFLVPIVEEVLFRGVIQQYVGAVATDGVGIAVATVLFVGIHLDQVAASATSVAGAIAALLPVTALSVAAGVAYARTENLSVPILIHVAYNGLAGMIGMVVTLVGFLL